MKDKPKVLFKLWAPLDQRVKCDRSGVGTIRVCPEGVTSWQQQPTDKISRRSNFALVHMTTNAELSVRNLTLPLVVLAIRIHISWLSQAHISWQHLPKRKHVFKFVSPRNRRRLTDASRRQIVREKGLHPQRECGSIFKRFVDAILLTPLVNTCRFCFLLADLWRLLLHEAPEGCEQVKRHSWRAGSSFDKGHAGRWCFSFPFLIVKWERTLKTFVCFTWWHLMEYAYRHPPYSWKHRGSDHCTRSRHCLLAKRVPLSKISQSRDAFQSCVQCAHCLHPSAAVSQSRTSQPCATMPPPPHTVTLIFQMKCCPPIQLCSIKRHKSKMSVLIPVYILYGMLIAH